MVSPTAAAIRATERTLALDRDGVTAFIVRSLAIPALEVTLPAEACGLSAMRGEILSAATLFSWRRIIFGSPFTFNETLTCVRNASAVPPIEQPEVGADLPKDHQSARYRAHGSAVPPRTAQVSHVFGGRHRAVAVVLWGERNRTAARRRSCAVNAKTRSCFLRPGHLENVDCGRGAAIVALVATARDHALQGPRRR